MERPAVHAPPALALPENQTISLEAKRDEVIIKIQDFEADVLDRTKATRIRLETPALAAWSSDDLQAVDENMEDGYSAPGYVAFMAGPDAMNEGVYHTMRDIARLYFDQFPDAPHVTVSLIIGGGVRDRETFLNAGDGTLSVGGQGS